MTDPQSTITDLHEKLRLARRERRAKEHQLDGIRRALCDAGIIQDGDPYSHADLEDVIRQAGPAEAVRADRAEAALARIQALVDECEDSGHGSGYPLTVTRIREALDEPGPDTEADRLAHAGVHTPGCDCDHTGMGVSWHSDDCPWRQSVLNTQKEK